VGIIGQFFGTLFAPIGTLFHYLFYLPVYNVLMLLYAGVHTVAPGLPGIAIAIFMLTIIVRLCLFPLTRKQLKSSREMQVLAPKVQELQRQYRNNPQELMAAQQALYREHGVSPYSGCLPLAIQMPFLYALYFSFYTALVPKAHETLTGHLQRINVDIYPFLPHLTKLPSTIFLWTDLAHPDTLRILPILAGVLTFLQLRMAQPVRKPTPPGQRADPNTQAMSSMQYIMPVMTFFFALNFASGLAFYWTISTAFSAAQQYFLSGLGSLFVGIPGMEHLVPEPQTPPAAPARPPTNARVVEADPAPPRAQGLAGLGALLRQLSAPTQQSLQNDDRPGAPPTNGKANGNGSRSGQSNLPLAVSVADDGEGTAERPARRPRSERSGPMLVKPAATGGASAANATGGATTNGSLVTENGVASSGSAGANGMGTLGERGPARRPAGGRPIPGGPSARRRPGGRPKGGR
jgi:YidC/Oxa1 family membrane protein insertase